MRIIDWKTLAITGMIGICLSCWAPRTIAEKAALVDELFVEYDSPESPGASVLVIEEGTIRYMKGFGSANLKEHRTVTPATNFRLASLTKQFTAMSILMLAGEAKLSVEDPLTKFFGDFPEYGKSITIRHLLTHTSGIVDYESLLPDTQTAQIHDKDVLTLLRGIDSTYFSPGDEYRYSNSGYALLSLIVEKVSGLSFAQFLNTSIFLPLGMKRTVAFEEGVSIVPERSYGYSRTDSGWVFADQSPTSAVLGDGGIYSSVEELLLWDHAYSAGHLVPLYLLKQALTPATLNDGSTTGYGFGIALDEYDGFPRHSHTGSTRGFRNAFVRFPVQGLTIIILTNRNEGNPIEIAEEIADLYLD